MADIYRVTYHGITLGDGAPLITSRLGIESHERISRNYIAILHSEPDHETMKCAADLTARRMADILGTSVVAVDFRPAA